MYECDSPSGAKCSAKTSGACTKNKKQKKQEHIASPAADDCLMISQKPIVEPLFLLKPKIDRLIQFGRSDLPVSPHLHSWFVRKARIVFQCCILMTVNKRLHTDDDRRTREGDRMSLVAACFI